MVPPALCEELKGLQGRVTAIFRESVPLRWLPSGLDRCGVGDASCWPGNLA